MKKAAGTLFPRLSRFAREIPSHWLRVLGLGLCLLFLFLLFSHHLPTFQSGLNLQYLLRQVALIALIGIGEGFVIISGGIDLSIGSVLGLSCLVHTMLVMEAGWPVALALPAVLLLCLLIGFLQGILVTRVGLQPFLATLGGLLGLRGVCRVMASGATYGYGSLHGTFRKIGTGFFLGIPIAFWILIGVALLCHFLLAFTILGRHLYASGRNPEAARCSGVRTDRVLLLAYMISALLGGLCGILFSAYLNQADSKIGEGYELWAIAVAVLGGCSLRGGEGTVIGIVVGAAIMKTMENGIILRGIDTEWMFVILAGVIVVVAILDQLVQKQVQKGTV